MKKGVGALMAPAVVIVALAVLGLIGEFMLDKVGLAKVGGPLTTWLAFALVLGVICLIILFIVTRDKPEESSGEAAIKRPTAPVKYMRSGDYLYDNVGVAIPPAANCSTDYSNMKIGDSVLLVPEPDNEYDSRAVALYHDTKHIGYLYKNKLQDMYHSFEARGGMVVASISAIPPVDKLMINLDFTKLGEEEEEDDDEYVDYYNL